jgi:hypothetical protein
MWVWLAHTMLYAATSASHLYKVLRLEHPSCSNALFAPLLFKACCFSAPSSQIRSACWLMQHSTGLVATYPAKIVEHAPDEGVSIHAGRARPHRMLVRKQVQQQHAATGHAR